MRRIFSIHRERTAIAFLAIALVCISFTFHHGWSSYDQKKVLNFTGKIVEYSYDNPHGMLKLEVDGKTWTVVLAPPSRMESRGLTREMLKNGTEVTVVGYPHLRVKSEMRAERITVGKKTTELR
jgi:membrane protein implicated in regulation of membrane protease activity